MGKTTETKKKKNHYSQWLRLSDTLYCVCDGYMHAVNRLFPSAHNINAPPSEYSLSSTMFNM